MGCCFVLFCIFVCVRGWLVACFVDRLVGWLVGILLAFLSFFFFFFLVCLLVCLICFVVVVVVVVVVVLQGGGGSLPCNIFCMQEL